MQDRVSETVSGQRLDRLLRLAEAGKRAYVQRWIGRTVSAVVEQYRSGEYPLAVTENYLKAQIVPEHPALVLQGRTAITCQLISPSDCGSPSDEEKIDVLARII